MCCEDYVTRIKGVGYKVYGGMLKEYGSMLKEYGSTP